MQTGSRITVQVVALLLIMMAALFGAAGTLDWPAGWAYIAITLVVTVGSRLLLIRHSPDLIAERASYAEKSDAKPWDRTLMPIVAVYGPIVQLVVAGLDKRWGWLPDLPLWLQVTGGVLLILASVFGAWAMFTNRFFSGVVRIQTDRGQVVVDQGPYRVVRHPGYLAGVVGHVATPVLLDSLWALIPGLATAGVTVLRTALEDRTLMAELHGYTGYAARTRYRLFPGIW